MKPMLAKDADLEKVKFPLVVQEKLDGIRAVVVNGKLLSRTHKPIPNLEIRAMLERPEFEGFDGELIVGNPLADDCYRKTSSYVMAPNKTGEGWTYRVFDLWDQGEASFMARRTELLSRRADEDRGSLFSAGVVLVNSDIVRNMDELEEFEQSYVGMGYEGVIARVPSAPYKFGRSGKTGPLLKIKRFVDFEARIADVYEEMHNANEAKTNELGRTERSTRKEGLVGKNTLGGFELVATNGPAEGVQFRCGTGFNREQRAELWAEFNSGTPNNNPLLGRIVKVKSFPIGVKDKPRHPVFLGFRDMEVDG